MAQEMYKDFIGIFFSQLQEDPEHNFDNVENIPDIFNDDQNIDFTENGLKVSPNVGVIFVED